MSEDMPSESAVHRVKSILRERTFRSLRHDNYRRYFFGQLVSFTGSWIQTTAVMWLAYDLTNDPSWPAYLLVAQVGPTLLVGPFGGAFADRFSKRTLILTTQFAFMINAVVLAILVGCDAVTPMSLLVIQCLGGLVQGIDLPTRLAFVSELVPQDNVINAVGLNSLLFNTARAVGPACAGILFVLGKSIVGDSEEATRFGATVCFSVNAISYFAVLFALWKIQPPPRFDRPPVAGAFWDGLRYLAAHPGLAGLVILTGCFCVFAWPILTLFPSYTKLVLGRAEGSYSMLLSAFGGGALIGALATATFGSIRRRGRFLLLGAITGWIGLWILFAVNSITPALFACTLLGFGMVLYLSTGQSTLQTSVPDLLRGRVMAIWAMMLSASSLPGHLTAGLVARSYPVSDVLFGMFVGVTLTILGLIVLVVSGAIGDRTQTKTI